ncbi:hypothetical protein [Pantanalinema sp. GBBB05]|uniref:hypothetical protein n=1 Tax=Pantanalinema sp. GBBB05 TaxID=2604139 RepID=UPI001DD48B92|nr:hypothetical protein [Pantanalinema sp. GBBB05]
MTWDIQYYPAAVAAGGSNGVVAGVFIPTGTDLPGISPASELGEAAKERKVAFAVANRIFDALNGMSNKLGFTVSRPAPSGFAQNQINQSLSLTTQFVLNHSNLQVGLLPLPASSIGKVAIADVFPNAAKKSANAAIDVAGILIPDSTIASFGGSIPSNTELDARSWIAALYLSFITQLTAHSSITAKDKGDVLGFLPALNYYSGDAITGLTEADLPMRSFFTLTYTFTVVLSLNQSNQTFDLAA